MTDLVRNARSALLISVVPLVLGAAACGQEDPAVDDGSGDEIFYDGDEKADGAFAPKPVGGTKTRRGYQWESDAGPPKDSRWAALFAATPNYRALGIRVLGGAALTDEKFRWEFGPMYYRGRLTPNNVKVFLVGQEGAQDESASGRTFTGSTGTKLQNFLRVLGIDRSYLFMNTFTYTIHGQYAEMDGKVSPKTRWLAQSPESPIVQHRHSMFNYMQEQNAGAINLIIGVGQAGRDSVVTWVQSRWEQKTPGSGATKCATITRCDASVIGPKVKVLGLPHPGAASPRNGGEDSLTSLSSQFTKAVGVVSSWAKADPTWLPLDPGFSTRPYAYKYVNYPIPYRDFAFGSMDVLGDWGTTSNRRDGGQSIQVFSDDGCYNNYAKDPVTMKCPDQAATNATVLPLSYRNLPDVGKSIPELPPGDLPYEFPRAQPSDFDPGPAEDLAKLLRGGAPDFAKLGVTAHESFGATYFHRGRLDDAKVLVLADQESHDDLFTARALTGSGGQRLQTFLKLLGAGTSYGIVRSLPVDTLDLSAAQALTVATNTAVLAQVKAILSAVVARGKTTTLITVGPLARQQLATIGAGALGGVNLKVVNLDNADDALTHVPGWQAALATLGVAKPSDYTGKVLTTIPRLDLPIHSRWWYGANGTRADRALDRSKMLLDGNYYKIGTPDWVLRLPPAALSPLEEAALLKAPK